MFVQVCLYVYFRFWAKVATDSCIFVQLDRATCTINVVAFSLLLHRHTHHAYHITAKANKQALMHGVGHTLSLYRRKEK